MNKSTIQFEFNISKKSMISIILIILIIFISVLSLYYSYMEGWKIGHSKGYTSAKNDEYYTAYVDGYNKGLEELSKKNYSSIFYKGESVGYYHLKANISLDKETQNAIKTLNGENIKTCKYEKCETKLFKDEEYCTIHRCASENCKSSIIRKNIRYCNAHKCVIPECNNEQSKNGYCNHHNK